MINQRKTEKRTCWPTAASAASNMASILADAARACFSKSDSSAQSHSSAAWGSNRLMKSKWRQTHEHNALGSEQKFGHFRIVECLGELFVHSKRILQSNQISQDSTHQSPLGSLALHHWAEQTRICDTAQQAGRRAFDLKTTIRIHNTSDST